MRKWGVSTVVIQEKDYAAAESALETALQHDPDHLASWIKRSLLFIGTDRLDEGLDALNREVLLDYETGVAWYLGPLIPSLTRIEGILPSIQDISGTSENAYAR